ncbi:hypothetical protein B0T10DRAFT_449413 [Thelonectria olida]|uniref:Ubiquinol-cytochrome-c reductase cytochrome c1 n=1 Tax=Thelonectria olida TaxID=1576542 RepID=A0A9P9AJJ5_9HYPO|nr:hypothetical protein B0T10DRAFT_449413 [Thelonectria olida]
MGNKNPPDERVVYLALKNVFKGPNAGVRQPKAIRRLISKSQEHGDVADLLKAHNIDTICNTARTLLTEQIFESTLKAKIRFPEVFDVSPGQSAEREASEAEAARNEANAIRGVVQGHQEDVRNVIQLEGAVETASVEICRDPKSSIPKRSRHAPSLFPVYLPFRTQHKLLVKVQTILEQACFAFGQRVMPDVLQKNRWDCPESAELNIWATEFLQRQSEFADRKSNTGKPLEKLFHSVADVRHTAVHRIRVSARGIEQFLLDAEGLATLLEDEVCLKSLTKLRRDTQLVIGELERNKHVLSSKLGETLKRTAAQRAELDRIEEEAIAEMVKEDGEYQVFAGSNLEQAIVSIDATAVALENEISSGVDDIDSVEDYGRV